MPAAAADGRPIVSGKDYSIKSAMRDRYVMNYARFARATPNSSTLKQRDPTPLCQMQVHNSAALIQRRGPKRLKERHYGLDRVAEIRVEPAAFLAVFAVFAGN